MSLTGHNCRSYVAPTYRPVSYGSIDFAPAQNLSQWLSFFVLFLYFVVGWQTKCVSNSNIQSCLPSTTWIEAIIYVFISYICFSTLSILCPPCFLYVFSCEVNSTYVFQAPNPPPLPSTLVRPSICFTRPSFSLPLASRGHENPNH